MRNKIIAVLVIVGFMVYGCMEIDVNQTDDSKTPELCRPSVGACDLDEYYIGTSNECPADAKSTELCRPSVDICDVAEYCDGLSDDCPTDVFAPSTTLCRASLGDYDNEEYCTGTKTYCPPDDYIIS